MSDAGRFVRQCPYLTEYDLCCTTIGYGNDHGLTSAVDEDRRDLRLAEATSEALDRLAFGSTAIRILLRGIFRSLEVFQAPFA